MKQKRRIIATGVCLTIFALMAVGSSSSSETTATKAIVGSDGEVVSEDKETTETTEEKKVVTIEEQVLVDQDGIKITATAFETDSIWGDGIKLLMENSSENDYTVGCDALIVNDYMITDLFAKEIAAGKSANETVYLSSSGLKAAGIDVIGKIEIYFHAYDSSYDRIFDDVYAEIKTSEYNNMSVGTDDSGVELFNENGIRIIGKTVDEDSFWGKTILLYCENNSGNNVGITVEDMSINGFMVTPYFSADIYDGKKAVKDITLMSSELEENGIEEINEVELKFHIYDLNSYGTILDSEAITFSAQ